MKALFKEKDSKAIEVYEERIVEQFKRGQLPEILFLIEGDFLDLLNNDTLTELFEDFSFKGIMEYEPYYICRISNKLSDLGIDRLKKLYESHEFLSQYIHPDEIGTFQELSASLEYCIQFQVCEILRVQPESPGVMIENKHVSELYLKKCNLKAIPELISKFLWLMKICLEGNSIKNLPNSIKNLKRMKILELGHNEFEDFPFIILELKSLVFVDLRCNRIKKIPRNINTLKNLKYLNLNRNEIEMFDSEITDLNGLKHLELSFNKITRISETLKELKFLEILNLDYNNLVTLPNSIGLLENIKKLHLNGNRINTLPESLLKRNALELFSMDTSHLDNKSNLVLAKLAQNNTFICKPPFTIRFFLGTPQT